MFGFVVVRIGRANFTCPGVGTTSHYSPAEIHLGDSVRRRQRKPKNARTLLPTLWKRPRLTQARRTEDDYNYGQGDDANARSGAESFSPSWFGNSFRTASVSGNLRKARDSTCIDEESLVRADKKIEKVRF